MNEKYRSKEEQFANEIKLNLIKSIPSIDINYFLIQQSTDIEDTKYSFDMIFNTKLKISVRLRKYRYHKYKDITIRNRSNMGKRTEIDKLIDGEGQLYFYGWLDSTETKIIQWILFDINKIRCSLKNNGIIYRNNDGSELKVYDFKFLKKHKSIISMGYKQKIELFKYE